MSRRCMYCTVQHCTSRGTVGGQMPAGFLEDFQLLRITNVQYCTVLGHFLKT